MLVKSLFLLYVICSTGNCGSSATGDNVCSWYKPHRECREDEVCITWVQECPHDNSYCNPRRNKVFTECIDANTYAMSYANLRPKSTERACGRRRIFVLGSTRQCFAPPCPPYWTYSCYRRTRSTVTCDNIKIQEGYVCTMGVTCTNGVCRPVPRIIYVGTNSTTSPCATVDCAPGYVCEPEQVVCIREPCPPLATCKPVAESPCRTYYCPANSRCVIRQVYCIRAPCPSRPYCLSIRQQQQQSK